MKEAWSFYWQLLSPTTGRFFFASLLPTSLVTWEAIARAVIFSSACLWLCSFIQLEKESHCLKACSKLGAWPESVQWFCVGSLEASTAGRIPQAELCRIQPEEFLPALPVISSFFFSFFFQSPAFCGSSNGFSVWAQTPQEPVAVKWILIAACCCWSSLILTSTKVVFTSLQRVLSTVGYKNVQSTQDSSF